MHLGRKKLGQSISRVNCTRCGLAILLPWSVYDFSPYPGRKYHIRVFEPGAKVPLNGSKYVPIMTDIKPAPEEVLKITLCNCKSNCKTTRCTCRKYGIFCSSICNTCIGSNCDNVNVSYQIDEEDLDNK